MPHAKVKVQNPGGQEIQSSSDCGKDEVDNGNGTVIGSRFDTAEQDTIFQFSFPIQQNHCTKNTAAFQKFKQHKRCGAV